MLPAERTLDIGVIRGDGIGPELVDVALVVLEAVLADTPVEPRLHEERGGAGRYAELGAGLAEDSLGRIRDDYDATLKGPVGLPDVRHPDGTEAGLLGGVLRGGLDAFANMRPVLGFPGVATVEGPVDYVIVRENTEGLYLSRGLGVGNDRAVVDQLLLTREGVERVVRFAFRQALTREGAPADGVRRVTCVDKSNVLRTHAFFRRIYDEVAEDFPEVERDYRYADAAGHDLVADPAHFDVLVMENFLGDVLSDVGAATVGGLGMCASANVGHGAAYFEPIHGSAPSLAGTDRANPVSQVLSVAMLLDHVGLLEEAARVRAAVRDVFGEGQVTLDRGIPDVGTAGVGRLVADRLR